jgi:hypothetical protein
VQIANPASFLAQKILIHARHRRSVFGEPGGAAAHFPEGQLFGKVDDAIREASLMATGRKLPSDRLAETARAGLAEIFGIEKKA